MTSKSLYLEMMLDNDNLENVSSVENNNYPNILELQEAVGLRYLAGWILYKYRNSIGFEGLDDYTKNLTISKFNSTCSWIQHISHGGPIEPCEEFFQQVKKMEHLFCTTMGPRIMKGRNINSKISEKIISSIPLSNSEFIKTFVCQRIFIRMKYFSYLPK